ncbi:hypothetical protein [Paeniglutamicibacter terrestris]|uniref:Uncharacterized protein n=1 Tax=Paeniglutamicibacter terrestris TaxID=2723403 RepID=A0ABX1G900_9MICC|nr:hypothetical protein [Paeniglutamicibacter terrestris]NKG22732.1 hypothetical protein [Paeniglutamicibacter terrestris]
MSQIKVWMAIWKFTAVATVIVVLLAATIAFYSLNAAVCFIALGILLGWSSLIARQRLAMNDTRTIMRQELRAIKMAPQTVSTKGVDDAAKRLELAISNLAREQSPLARELHLKTVEEIRFLQAQISAVLQSSSRH